MATTHVKGKIGVLIEEHFDPSEYRRFNEYLPSRGYLVEYISHLWGQPQLGFGSNPEDGVVRERVVVTTELEGISLADYRGIICIGGYAMDRLRYQADPRKGQPSRAPAVVLIREAMRTDGLKVGTICHSLWLMCADPALLKDRRVTCAHNVISDVEGAGAEIVFDGDQTADIVIDADLISGKHPGVVDTFMEVFVAEIEKQSRSA